MKEQNAERLSEYEKAQIEFAKGKAEFLQGCGGCLMIPIIIIILLCIVILIGLIASPFMGALCCAETTKASAGGNECPFRRTPEAQPGEGRVE